MAYAYTKTYDLRYSDFDFKDELAPVALLQLLQEAACRSADELGFGYDDLRPRGLGFIIVNSYVEFARPIVLGDNITVETWPLPPRHVVFDRAYRVTVKGEEVAAAISRWCLVDLKTFTMLTPEHLNEAHELCPYRAEFTAKLPPSKIPHATREVCRMRVGVSRCDHYLHANNTRYAEFFADCFTMEELAARKIRAFQIVYSKQAKEGEELVLYRDDLQDCTVCEARVRGEVTTQFRVWFADEP